MTAEISEPRSLCWQMISNLCAWRWHCWPTATVYSRQWPVPFVQKTWQSLVHFGTGREVATLFEEE